MGLGGLGGLDARWRVWAVCTGLGIAAGAVFGAVRGLSYLPTLPVAVIEGAFLFGVPATLLGLLAAGASRLFGRH